MNKWIYSTSETSCLGVHVKTEEQHELLKDVFCDKRKGKVTELTFSAAKDLINNAKENIKEKPKQKRTRRSKEQIEADKKSKEDSK